MPDLRLKLKQISGILRVILCLQNIFTGKSHYGFVTVPLRNCPKMTEISIGRTPDLDAEIAIHRSVIHHARVEENLQVFFRMLRLRSAVPDSCYRRRFHKVGQIPISFITAFNLVRVSAVTGTSGSRRFSSSRPISFITNLQGAGDDSTKFASISGKIL